MEFGDGNVDDGKFGNFGIVEMFDLESGIECFESGFLYVLFFCEYIII